MAEAIGRTDASPSAISAFRWLQLLFGVICMAMIANLQYGWTLFVNPIDAKFHWGTAAIQVAFTLFVFTETWLVPIEGWFVDKYGPAMVVFFGGIMVAAAWMLNSIADSLPMLYAGAIVGGMGASAVYGTCVGNALKWFPDKRGLAAGFTAAGFGAGAALTVAPIAHMIKASGYQSAFWYFGIGQGAVILLLSIFLRKPPANMPKPAPRRVAQNSVEFTPGQVLRTPVFYVMYLMMVLVASGGLMAAAQIAPIAKDFKIADVPVSVLGLSGAALTLAITFDRIFDGFGRPFFGWVSDQIGRENTMFLAFSIGAASLTTLALAGSNPIIFVVVTAIFFGVFGEIYSLFPATAGDTFGSKFATTNNGMLYTAKGTASLVVPIASIVAHDYGWSAVFAISVGANIIAALMALIVLKPMRRRLFARTKALAASSNDGWPGSSHRDALMASTDVSSAARSSPTAPAQRGSPAAPPDLQQLAAAVETNARAVQSLRQEIADLKAELRTALATRA